MLEEELRLLINDCYSKDLSACPKHTIFQPEKAIKNLKVLIEDRCNNCTDKMLAKAYRQLGG